MDLTIKPIKREVEDKFVKGAVFEEKHVVTSDTLRTIVLIEEDLINDAWFCLERVGCEVSMSLYDKETIATYYFRGIAKNITIEMEV